MPKKRRLEFLISEDHNSITRKSKAHYAMIEAVNLDITPGKGAPAKVCASKVSWGKGAAAA